MNRNDRGHWMLTVKRDPDGCIYSKEELCGLLTGGFEPQPKPWPMDPIPSSFQFALLGENWDQFEPLMKSEMHRTPCGQRQSGWPVERHSSWPVGRG